jgi:hypothetical protein
MEYPYVFRMPVGTSDTLLEDWYFFRQRQTSKRAGVLDDVRWASRYGCITIGLQIAWYHWKCANYDAKVKLNCLYGKMQHRTGEDS